ncbi:Fluc/FEX family fluoride channel [Allonocardiopsis opalescens]|uniref:Fluoride-specific ion channel FluC n=1 Tax=Allonocardiopsis opalescens TaxID=1144618 RepID=A0A2T0Q6J3_9ACTN|nr:CrcB family protein [Allonocardiopsis opalescens]PRX99412.1 CrcB protein [Allonocardiopsis opalescens]
MPKAFSAARRELPVLALVALGGGAGAVLRQLLVLAVPVQPGAFPWTTLAVNTGGALLLGALAALATEARPRLRALRPLLGTGLLGGFTTFSGLAGDAYARLAAGAPPAAAGYLLLSLAGGVLAAHVGWSGARRLAALVGAARRGGRPAAGREPEAEAE